MAAFVRMFKTRWFSQPKPVDESYQGRNVIVTGATSGIGLEAAAKFAALGAAKVIIAARDLQKGERTKAAIEARVGTMNVLEVWELNMDSYDSVVAFAQRADRLEHLDIAILNAGVCRSKYGKSQHGWEETLQVNTLSTVLLGILLLPKLKASKHATKSIPVLEFVNSGLHQNSIVSPEVRNEPNVLEWFNKPENYGETRHYGFSKTFLMYATNKLAEEVSSGDVIVTSICPGVIRTDLGRDHYFPGVGVLFFIAGLLLMNVPEVGANTIMSGTTQGEKVHMRFWKDDQVQPVAPSIAGEENKKLGLRIWNEIVEALVKDVPTVRKTLDSIQAR